MAAEAKNEGDETRGNLPQVSKPARGPSMQPDSYRDIEQRTGIPIARIKPTLGKSFPKVIAGSQGESSHVDRHQSADGRNHLYIRH